MPICKEAVKKTDDAAGDGTTTAIVLFAMVREGLNGKAALLTQWQLKVKLSRRKIPAVTEMAKDGETKEQIALPLNPAGWRSMKLEHDCQLADKLAAKVHHCLAAIF